MDVALRGEIQSGPHMATGGGNARRVPGVEAVNAITLALLRLDIPLEVAPYLPQQRAANALRDGEFLRARHAFKKSDGALSISASRICRAR